MKNKIAELSVIIIVALIVSLGRFALDSFLPSMPFINDRFNIEFQDVELTLSLYLFSFSVSQLFYGPLSDRIGRKPVLIFGFVIFIMGSLLCWSAESFTLLLMGRFLSGIGMGVGPSLKRAILADMFEGAALTRAAAFVSNALIITLLLAPVIGGYIQEFLSWRENFLFPVIYALLILSLIFYFLNETNIKKENTSFTVKNVISGYAFQLKNKDIVVYSLCSAIAFSSMMLYFQSSAYILIRYFKLSPGNYGWISVLLAISYLSGGLIVSRLANIFTNQILIQIGFFMMILGSLLFLCLFSFYPPTLFNYLFPILICFVAARIIIPCSLSGAMSNRKSGGTASSLMGSIQMALTALMSFLYSYV